jgi:phosphoserine phosphatase
LFNLVQRKNEKGSILPLTVRKVKDKEYLYYLMSGSKRLYLGTSNKPKVERIYEAIRYIRNQIKEQEEQLRKLEDILRQKRLEPKISRAPDYKLIIFDLDGVIYDKPWYDINNPLSDKIAVSTWDVLFQELGIYNIHEKLAQNYVSGVFNSYMEWTDAACQVLKSIGLDKKTFQNIINRRPLSLGAVELFKTLHEYGVKTAVITGSFDELVQRASRELGGFDYSLAHCKLIFNDKGLLEKWELNPIDYKDKADFVEKISKESNIPLDLCAYIGDDVNDLEAFQKVGLAIAFNCRKPQLLQSADVVIESKDLSAVLPYLNRERGK